MSTFSPAKVGLWLTQQMWVWALGSALALWVAILATKGWTNAVVVLPVAFSFAALYVIVGVGQMFVISAGPGNIDLSIPMVMTLAAYLSTGYMHGSDDGLLVGVLIAVGVGGALGLINASLIRFFSMPPMIVTLAVGLIAQSCALAYAKLGIAKPGPALQFFATGKLEAIPFIGPGTIISGAPILPAVLIMISLALVYFVRRSVYARSVFAHGQNPLAAYLAGVRTQRTMILTYVISGICAGTGGLVLAGFQGGASHGMATDYLLFSIAVVVLGGTPISGGRATVLGTWSASLFLFLVLSLLNSFQVPIGVRHVITGLMILLVLIAGAGLARAQVRK